MDIILLALGLACMIIGILGSFLPVLPGPPISWLGILFVYLTDEVAINYWILVISGIICIITVVLDYIIPSQGTKRFGGSSYGIWGTNIGLVVGIFLPIPLGFIIGPFVGAFVGEMIYNSKDKDRALKAATGSFLGFLASTFMKFIVCVGLFGLYMMLIWNNRAAFIN